MAELVASVKTCDLVRTYLPSNQDLADMCAFFSVFCDVTRVKMLSALSIDELCVGDLATLLSLNQTTVSHQLKILRDAGLVSTRREGKIIFYRLASDNILLLVLNTSVSLPFLLRCNVCTRQRLHQ